MVSWFISSKEETTKIMISSKKGYCLQKIISLSNFDFEVVVLPLAY